MKGTQAAIWTYLTDESMQAMMRTDPERALKPYDLTAEERGSLVRLFERFKLRGIYASLARFWW